MGDLTHRAEVQEDGSILFLFAAGDHAIKGQVPSVDEYRAFRVFFEGWAGVQLPGADLLDEGRVHVPA